MKEKGLSLLEVLIVLGVSIIVGGLLLVIIVNSAGVFYKQSAKVQEGLNINDALSKFRSVIKESKVVAASFTQGATYTSGASQLVLKVPSIDSSKNIIADTFDHFVFLLDQKKLVLKTFPAAQSSRVAQDQIFSTVVDSLLFQYLSSANPPVEVTPTSASKIRLTLTLKQKTGAGFQTQTATSEANLRND